MNHDLLNPYQRNSVAVRLQSAETTLREALAELTDQNKGILYRHVGTISEEQQTQVRLLIDAALDEIAYLAEALSLPVEIRNNRAAVVGKLTILSVDLYEMQSRKLVSYGEVAPGLQEVLDPPLERLLTLTDKLRSILVERNSR